MHTENRSKSILRNCSIQKSAKLINNILINHHEYKYISSNITSFISDHLPQFITFENFTDSLHARLNSHYKAWNCKKKKHKKIKTYRKSV